MLITDELKRTAEDNIIYYVPVVNSSLDITSHDMQVIFLIELYNEATEIMIKWHKQFYSRRYVPCVQKKFK